MPELTMGSLFDGIGGFPLAAVRNGITPLWASRSPSKSRKHTSPTWFMSEILQSSMARSCRPWTSSAGAVRVRTSRSRAAPVPVCKAQDRVFLWSRFG